MPAEMLTKNERTASQPIPTTTAPDDELREWARKHVERVRRLKLHYRPTTEAEIDGELRRLTSRG